MNHFIQTDQQRCQRFICKQINRKENDWQKNAAIELIKLLSLI